MSKRTVLLVGNATFEHDATRAALDPALDLELFTGSSLDDVEKVLSDHRVDTVLIDPDVDVDTRLGILRHILMVSESTSVHIKDRDTGAEALMPFVNGVLTGLTWHQWSWSGGDATVSDSEPPGSSEPAIAERGAGPLRRIWDYVFGRSEVPHHPPPPPYSPGAGGA